MAPITGHGLLRKRLLLNHTHIYIGTRLTCDLRYSINICTCTLLSAYQRWAGCISISHQRSPTWALWAGPLSLPVN